jgi:hypothetical protein
VPRRARFGLALKDEDEAATPATAFGVATADVTAAAAIPFGGAHHGCLPRARRHRWTSRNPDQPVPHAARQCGGAPSPTTLDDRGGREPDAHVTRTPAAALTPVAVQALFSDVRAARPLASIGRAARPASPRPPLVVGRVFAAAARAGAARRADDFGDAGPAPQRVLERRSSRSPGLGPMRPGGGPGAGPSGRPGGRRRWRLD